jgi:WXG100 family type VII secretion target
MAEYSFRVDLDELDALIARMAAFEQRVETLCDDVERDVGRLHGQWSGHAAEEHLQAHREWREGAATMRRSAAELRRVVTTAHRNYAAATSANARMWG